MKYHAPYLYLGQNGDLAPEGKTTKWGRLIARIRHYDCCTHDGEDKLNQRRLAAAWNLTRHLSITQLERQSEKLRSRQLR